jgi:hypothetical protein
MTEQAFSDPIAHGYDRQGESEISTTQSADDVLRKAAAHFLETRDPAKSRSGLPSSRLAPPALD